MKRKLLIFFIIALVAANALSGAVRTFAEEENEEDILSKMVGAISADELNEKLDELFSFLGKDGGDFKEKILAIVNGDLSVRYDSLFSAVLSLVFDEIGQFAVVFLFIVGLILAFSLVKALNPDVMEGETGGVIRFALMSLSLGALTVKTFAVFQDAYERVKSVSAQTEVVFPPLITVMTFTGSNLSAGLYRPVCVFLSSFVTGILTKIVFPLIFFSLIITTVSELSETLKTDGILKFVGSMNKWILGIITVVFTFFITVKGASTGYSDGIALRLAKYAIGNSVPIVGGFLRDGSETVLASGVLIKNALGVCGLALIAFYLVVPVVKIAVFTLFLKLTAALSEMLGDAKTGAYLYKIAGIANYALAAELVISYLYIITFVTIIFSGGAFV